VCVDDVTRDNLSVFFIFLKIANAQVFQLLEMKNVIIRKG